MEYSPQVKICKLRSQAKVSLQGGHSGVTTLRCVDRLKVKEYEDAFVSIKLIFKKGGGGMRRRSHAIELPNSYETENHNDPIYGIKKNVLKCTYVG